MNRREFLKQALVAAVSLGLPRLLESRRVGFMPEDWMIELDDEALGDCISFGKTNLSDDNELCVEVIIDTRVMWACVTAIDTNGVEWRTGDGRIWLSSQPRGMLRWDEA